MANDRPETQGSSSPQPASTWEVAVVAGLIGVLLVALGVPRLIAAVQALEARGVVWDLYTDARVSPGELAHASAALAAAEAWTRDGERDGERSLLLLHQAVVAPAEAAPALWDAAEAAAVSALSVAPGQPSVWARLADLRERRGDREGAVRALRMSMLSGSFVPALMVPRIEQGLRLLPALDHETLDLLKRQIRLTWVAHPEFVVTLSARPVAGPLVREALAELSESELKQFQHQQESKR
jgi:hypothetical protein